MAWQLQDAKNRFSEVVKKAVAEGPQDVTIRGKRTAVVVSAEQFDRLAGRQQTFKEFLLAGPAWDDEFVEMVNDRRPWELRDVDL